MDEQQFLIRLAEGPISGDRMARELGMTRAAVWKRVQALRDSGVGISARAGSGYVLDHPLDLLDGAVVGDMLRTLGVTDPVAPEIAWTVDSTNSELLRRPVPARGVGVLLAERQTGGRGRRGRAWSSPLAANLYLSLSRSFSTGLARLAGLSLVTGVATVAVLHDLGVEDARLKWPNDVVIGDRKLGGVLVEGSGEAAGSARAVVGIGLNVRMPAAVGAHIDQPWIDLASLLASPPSRNALAAAVLARLLPAFERFEREGLAPFLAQYQRHDCLSGRQVSVLVGEQAHAGIADGVAEDGALRVRIGDDVRHFHSGEVSVRRR